MISSIQRWGGSQGIRFPKYLLEQVNFEENEKVEVKVENGKLVISKAKQRPSLKEMFENFDGNYEPIDINFGKPVGDEIW